MGNTGLNFGVSRGSNNVFANLLISLLEAVNFPSAFFTFPNLQFTLTSSTVHFVSFMAVLRTAAVTGCPGGCRFSMR